MSTPRGMMLAMASVLLVSAAQLGMRWSMTRLPQPAAWLQALGNGGIDLLALAVVAAAICAYALSMLCWMGALNHLPLSRAYSLLSISYALVYLGAAWLPGFGEPLSPLRTLGVGLVMAGVLTINSRRSTTPQPAEQ